MNSFFERIKGKIQQFMTGRYGSDSLSTALLVASLVFFVITLVTRLGIFLFLALIALGFTYYRMLSKDFDARSRENTRYLELTAKLRKMLRVQKKRFDGRKDYRFFKCPGCGQEVRVPKGKGHIRITCPKCSVQFDRTV